MSRFGSEQTGVVVSVDDAKDDRFGLGWKRLADGEAFEKPTRPARRTRSSGSTDDPTPTGQTPTRRQHTDPTPSAQIRAQRAADPFYGGN